MKLINEATCADKIRTNNEVVLKLKQRIFIAKSTDDIGDIYLPEKKPNNPFDPWSFLPFSSNTIFPESDSDVEKKIRELKIIETWLNFNLEFTRSVIKTMEIKTEALNTLKDFSKSQKDKGLDEFVDAMNKKIITDFTQISAFKNKAHTEKSVAETAPTISTVSTILPSILTVTFQHF